MTKGELTRERIVAAAAPLFNQRGFAGASMSDLMAATGLEKGGIYRHFASKGELALAAFDHTFATQSDRIRSLVDAERDAVGRMTALATGIARAMERPAIAGGCPLLNTAIDADDGDDVAHAALRKRARAGLRRMIDYARGIIERGIADGELAASVSARAEAEAFVGNVEGALMLSKVFDDPRYVRQAVEGVRAHFERLARARRH